MSALSEALKRSQDASLLVLEKSYLRGAFEDDGDFLEECQSIGCTDASDLALYLNSMRLRYRYGAEPTQAEAPKPATKAASEGQWKFIRDLADRAQTVAPDGPLTAEQASTVIDQLKAGTYNPDEWTVPF